MWTGSDGFGSYGTKSLGSSRKTQTFDDLLRQGPKPSLRVGVANPGDEGVGLGDVGEGRRVGDGLARNKGGDVLGSG